MIKYKLQCKKCNKTFDSWFSSSKEFERIKTLKMLNCNYCNSKNIDKTLMAPNLNSRNSNDININEYNFKEFKKQIRNYQNFIKRNFKYVGDNFVYEARSIHYSNKKVGKGIFGKAKIKDIKELKEEGINTQVLPWFEDKEN
tara:strand:- start:698 stop:1123 length:426 start_codon:yes stop_codon:yes gene_type:complete